MPITTKETTRSFDETKVAKGDFIRARYHSWEAAHNGIVANVTEKEIRVYYVADIGNVTNYFTIPIGEVAEGLWNVSVSRDLTSVETEGGINDA